MNFFKNKKKRIYFFAFIFLAGLVFLFFNSRGVIKYLRLKSEVEEIHRQVEKTEEENRRLEDEADSLRKQIPAKIERMAREKYDMQREGEKVIETSPSDSP
jgi:cell division protein FtsL